MQWVTLVAAVLTLIGVCWTVYRTDIRGARDLNEGRLKELREKRREAYLNYLTATERVFFVVNDEFGAPIFEPTNTMREFIMASVALDIYGSLTARQAAHVIRQILLPGPHPLSSDQSKKLYDYTESFIDIIRADLGVDGLLAHALNTGMPGRSHS
jgi:hypothetical protein